MPFLDRKVAIVTGAGRGIGRGVSIALGREGAHVMVSGRKQELLDETAAKVRDVGGTALTAICDVTDKQHLDALVERTVAEFGTIDILVNNAQNRMLNVPLLDAPEENFVEGFVAATLATFRLMKACHPYLRGGGVIVNFGTGAGIRPDPIGYGCYAAVKEAVRTLSRTAAVEWGPDGIRVHTIVPLAGSEGLRAWAEQRPEEARKFFDTVPLGRVGDPEADIGRVIAFLCGPDSAYITGNTIALDGGQAYLH